MQWQHSIPAPFAIVAAYDHPLAYLLHHWVPLYLPAMLFQTHLLPFLALAVIMVALPIKTYAFFTMNKQGWLTRSADTMGGEGQTAATLEPQGAI